MMLSEHDEAVVFAQYLQLKGYKFAHIPNETYTTSWNQKRKNKMEGVSSGVPDYLICVKGQLIFIELKRVKGGRVSDNQKGWLEALNDCKSVNALVANGADEAIQIIEKI